MTARTPYFVYIDEAGDRGWGGRSSPVFVLSAVVVRGSNDKLIRQSLDGINEALGRDPNTLLHWAENIREHSDRKYVARQLAEMPATFMNVVVCKDSLIGTGSQLSRADYQYNYLLRRLLERVSWYVRDQGGLATVHLAHVRRFKYPPLMSYLTRLRSDHFCNIYWPALKNGSALSIEQPNKIRGLQVADLVAGCVYAAVRSDRHGDQEPAYLRTIHPRLWTGPTNKLSTYGLNFVADAGHNCADHFDWLRPLLTA